MRTMHKFPYNVHHAQAYVYIIMCTMLKLCSMHHAQAFI